MNERPPLKLGLGIFPDSVRGAIESAETAERLKFDTGWVLDTPCIRPELFTTLGAIRARVSNLVLGTGVTNVLTRHETVLASAIASLDEMCPGRTILGIGTGDSAVRMVGIEPARLGVLEERIRRLRSLLRGDVVEGDSPEVRYRIATPATRVPIYVAGAGPKLLELAGRIADGVIMGGGATRTAVQAGLQRIEKGAKSAGRHLRDIPVVLWLPFSVADDAAAARSAVRPYVARAAIGPSATAMSRENRRAAERIREAYDYDQHMAPGATFQELVPDALVDDLSIAGDTESCRARIESLADLPISELAIVPYFADGESQVTTLGIFAELARAGNQLRSGAE